MTSLTIEEQLLRALIGSPTPPRCLTHSLYEALRRGLVPPQMQKEARALLDSFPYPRRPTTAIPDRSEYHDPGWDDVVRALDEDR
jgi:hypothetical protein